ncbi:MAG: DUF4154 domain-containing protein [Pseudomonadales bacterium]|nr:DUF4154 domain-containing protein [Pseudomonadales bacterium]
MTVLISWTRPKNLKCAWMILSCLIFSLVSNLSHAQASFDEEDIKAAFLYNFADFISWPYDGSGSVNRSSLNYCVLSEATVQRSLRSLLTQEENATLQRNYVFVSDRTELEDCDLVFLGEGDSSYFDELAALAASEVLTVGDHSEFLAEGGMIQLSREQDRIQVIINLDLVNQSGFQVSSQLLRLVNIYELNAQ